MKLLQTYWVTHDPEDPVEWHKIEAADPDDAIRIWVENDPERDRLSDHFQAWVRDFGSGEEWVSYSVRLETALLIYVDGRLKIER